jgi:hypothetical protein
MYTKNKTSAQKENGRESSCKTDSAVSVGDPQQCPECKAIGRVVWISEDKKRMGVQCGASHRERIKPKSKYGATQVSSTKTKKNVVFLMAIA